MKISLQRLRALIKKEFIQLFRDSITLRMLVALPIAQLLLFGYAINTDPKNLPTAVISRDNSFLTRSIVSAMKNTDYFEIVAEPTSDAECDAMLRRGDVVFALTIPENFTQDVIRGNAPSILLQADASDPTTIASATAALNGISEQILAHDFTGTLASLRAAGTPFSVILQKNYNPEGFTRYNIIPALIGLVLIFTGVMMTALALTRERERGTMENLLAMPVLPVEIMIGKITPFIFISLLQTVIILLMAIYLFGVPIFGSLALLYGAILLFIICNLSLGFLISTVAKNQTQALQMSIFVLLPSLMLSGFMFPFQGMPGWAQCIGSCVPLTYFIRICRSIMLKGADFADIFPHFWPLILLVAIITGLTLKAYKNTLD